jgi:hypothetical protein
VAQLTTRPDKFAAEVNAKLPGARRQISADDVRDMTSCGLVGKYGYYMQLDIETIRAILQYEKLRENRQKRGGIKNSEGVMHCRRCGAVLVPKPESKKGRPNEYCDKCQPFRGRERQRKWRKRQVATTMN